MNVISHTRSLPRPQVLCLAIALMVGAAPVLAQQMDHANMKVLPAAATTPAKKPAAQKPATQQLAAKPQAKKKKPADSHAGHDMASPQTALDSAPASSSQPAVVDHSAMGHDMPMPNTPEQADSIDHAAMGHAMPMARDPAHSMDQSAMAGTLDGPIEPITPIPALTDADRAAALPPPVGHPVHDDGIHNYTLFNRLEGWNADLGTGKAWELVSWIGTDLNRVWLRSEGERIGSQTESADLELLYGRSIARWWDLVVGVRHDFKPGASQDFAAIGVIGLAPYKFELEATAYIGDSGQTAARLEVEYETLFTNRLILQPLVEVNLYGKNDQARGIGSGLGTVEAGLRLRYEFTRRFAPYVGVVYERSYGNTAEFRRDKGEGTQDTRLVAGLRIWF